MIEFNIEDRIMSKLIAEIGYLLYFIRFTNMLY